MKTIIVEQNGKQTEYGVNNSGHGLWHNGKQIVGTCDFEAHNPAELMRKLKSDKEEQFNEPMKMVRGSANGWK